MDELNIKYNGEIEEKKTKKNIKPNFREMGVWLFTLIVSLTPAGFSILDHYNTYKQIDDVFLLDLVINGQLIWFFATVLLFAVVNNLLKNKLKLNVLSMIGICIFVIMEGLWLFGLWKIELVPESLWFFKLSCVFIALALVISTPLEIKFMKEVGEK